MWEKFKSKAKYLIALVILGVSAMLAYLWQKNREKVLTLGKEYDRLKTEKKLGKLKDKKVRLEVETEKIDEELKVVDEKLKKLAEERVVAEESTDIEEISNRANDL